MKNLDLNSFRELARKLKSKLTETINYGTIRTAIRRLKLKYKLTTDRPRNFDFGSRIDQSYIILMNIDEPDTIYIEVNQVKESDKP